MHLIDMPKISVLNAGQAYGPRYFHHQIPLRSKYDHAPVVGRRCIAPAPLADQEEAKTHARLFCMGIHCHLVF